MDPRKLLTRAEAAAALGISPATLRRREGKAVWPIVSPLGEHLFWEIEIRALVDGKPPPKPGDSTPSVAGEALDRFNRAIARGATKAELMREFELNSASYYAALRNLNPVARDESLARAKRKGPTDAR